MKTHSNDVIEVEALDAVEAAGRAIAAVNQLTPPGGVVLNLVLTVALRLPRLEGEKTRVGLVIPTRFFMSTTKREQNEHEWKL